MDQTAGPYAGEAKQQDRPATPTTPKVSVADPALAPGDEIVSERGEYTRTFATDEPGVMETRVYQAPVNFQEGDTWVSIDNRLTADSAGVLRNGDSPVDLAVAKDSDDPQLVDLDFGQGRGVSWAMSKATDVPRSQTATTARFAGLRPQVDLKLHSIRGGVKEEIILRSASTPRTFDFPMDLTGLTARMAGGSVELVDTAGEVTAVIPQGFMTDANDEVSQDVSMELVKLSGKTTLRVSVDDAWLNAPDRAYPVVVDPTVQFDVTGDTMINSGDSSYNYAGWTFMRAGLFGSNKFRSLMKFNVDTFAGGWVESASVNVYNESSASCTPTTIQAKRIESVWYTTSVGWPNPTLGSVIGQTSAAKGGPGCAPGYVSVPITQAMRDWIDDPDTNPNWGLALTANEFSTDSAKTFTTMEEGVNEPYLKVTWRQKQLGVLPYFTFNDDELTDRLRQRVNVATSNLLMEASDVNLSGVAGMNMTVGRYYNSRFDGTDVFGYGWNSTIGNSVRMVIDPSTNNATFETPTGGKELFTYRQGMGSWNSPDGLNAKLSKTGTTYTLRMVDSGLRYRFVDGTFLDEVEDKNGNKITYGYSPGGRVNAITDTRGETTTVNWGANGYISKITDPRGRLISYGYTGNDLTSVTDQLGRTTTYAYDTNHNLTSVTDAENNTTRYEYDTTDRLNKIIWADSTTAKPAITRYTFTPDQDNTTQHVAVTDQRGNAWTYTFDERGRQTKYLTPRAGSAQTTDYDDKPENADGSPVSQTNAVNEYSNAQGGIGTLTYDGYNVKDFTEDNGAKSTFDYLDPDTPDKPSKYTDSRGVGIDYDWNNREQLTSVKTSDSTTTINYQSASDACPGVPSSSKDGKGNTTTYSYTGCNLTKIDRPAPAGDSTMTYDATNRLRTVLDGKGNKQVIDYNDKDEVTKITYTKPGASTSTSSVSYTYDNNGNRTSRVDTHNSTTKNTAWALDARNRVTAENLPGVANSYTYDVAGNMASMTTPRGTTGYTYDIENDPKTITPPDGNTINYSYGQHKTASITYPGGVTDRQDRDKSGRIERIYQDRANSNGTFTLLTDLNYGYTSPGGKTTDNVYTIDDPVFDFHVTYDYDSSGRIKKSTSTKNSVKRSEDVYNYDANSNMTSWTDWISPTQTDSFTGNYNAANQLTSVGGATTLTNTYDANGMWTGDNQGGNAAYDERARATTMTQRDQDDPRAMEYDGTSQVERTKAGGITFTNSLLGVTSSTTSSGTTDYVLAPDGRVLGQKGPDGKRYYYLSDRLGSTIGVVNSAGERVNDYWYDPFGGYQGGKNPEAAADIPLVNWRYTGEWLDTTNAATGNYKIGLRYYDPGMHRWTQTDPAERITNPAQPAETQPYAYVGCNPTNQTDPTGAMGEPWVGCAISIGGGVLATFGLGVSVFGGPFTVGFGFAGFAFAGASIVQSCYDDNGDIITF
ncbi:RHS repeat-associated core domain-containing protein [Janibacter melonis]|uniref:RHS repeat-associated core domain-containing protein n=2 Tax=Janibacter melonis TaxID=262209 RepID=UPI0013D1ACE5|nr:RHS repeat-associated core domain-containing protein [Janibacter melonis]